MKYSLFILSAILAISAVAGVELRILGTGSNGRISGRLLIQQSSSSSWYSVGYSSFGTYDAKQACRFMGFSSSVSSSYSSVSSSSSYPVYSQSWSCSTSTPSSSVTMSSFSSYCATSTSYCSSCTAVYLTCDESGTYTGGGIGAYAGSASSSFTRYVRTYLSRFEVRYAHSTSWGSLCSYPSTPDLTTRKAMCGWLHESTASSPYVTTGTNYHSFTVRGLDCASSSYDFTSCSYSATSSCPTSTSSDTVKLYCTGSSTPSPYSPSSSSSSSDPNIGLIIGASVGGIFGFIILVTLLSVGCAACAANNTATSGAALTNFPVQATSDPVKTGYGNDMNSSQNWGQPQQQPAPFQQQAGGYGAPAPYPPPPGGGFYGGGDPNAGSYGAPPPGFGASYGGGDPNMAYGAPPPQFGAPVGFNNSGA